MDEGNLVHMCCKLPHAHCVQLFRVLCAVRTRLWSQWWFHVFICSRASNHGKHDMGALSMLNAETLKRVPSPLFGRLVRCSAHGHLCETMVYICTMLDVQIIHANSLQCTFSGWERVVNIMFCFTMACEQHLVPFTSYSKTECVCMCTVVLVPGVDQTRQDWGSFLASREGCPCCLLSQLWRGAPPAAGYWRDR